MSEAFKNSLYSPYGAYELKASYQRSLFLGTLAMVVFVGLVAGTYVVATGFSDHRYAENLSEPVISIIDVPLPSAVRFEQREVRVAAPYVAAPRVGIPKPVADEEVLDEDVVLATRDELAEIVGPDITQMGEGGGNIQVDIADEDFLPAPDDFVAVEISPEIIHKKVPEYPRLARTAGITGTVWVKALVDEEGNVIKAIVGKSSGVASLDEAAVKAAYKNTFKPGIQNGRPVKVWVTYEMEFVLNR
jgi:protein TonB